MAIIFALFHIKDFDEIVIAWPPEVAPSNGWVGKIDDFPAIFYCMLVTIQDRNVVTMEC